MKISEILLNLDIPSNEIKSRFKNKQIKLDGEDVDNIDIDINLNFIMDFGDFLSYICNDRNLKIIYDAKMVLGLKVNELFGTNIPKLKELFDQFYCLTISKNEHYILIKN